MIPFWAKDPKIGLSTINARAETLATSAAFREAVTQRRSLIPADLFYEWQQIDRKTKQPYAIGMRDGSMFGFAGLWERWNDKARDQPLETYTIITTDPNSLVELLHDRMPVIVPRKDYARWLGAADSTQVLPTDLLRPYPAEEMVAWKVDARVGNARNDDPDLLNPATIGS